MDRRSIAILEFPHVRDRLAALTSFEPSRRLAEALEPSPDPVLVARGLQETDEARALLADRPDVGIGGARDIGPLVERAARGGRLEPSQLLAVAATLEAADRLRRQLADDPRPLIRDLARHLHPLSALAGVLARSIAPDGEILDGASPRLGSLRAAVRVAQERLRRRLDELVSGELGGALQEPIVTVRGGRYVVPVKAEARGRVPGIVHDASGSGQTLFVEPLAVVELANAWREAEAAVVAEEGRILDELSALVGSQAEALRETLAALARLDFWLAKARLAEAMAASRPETVDRPELVLLAARHPGLTGHVVPIDVRLGGAFTALVITGPNTGGKTVTLRTIGLLSLMHQAGLHIPAAPGSRLPVFRDVFADIGDEQSIAQNLSTYSSHLQAIIPITAAAGPGALVLLDELGAGTDPAEGAALAQALLDHFIRTGALVAATTHYAELKAYAATTPGAQNASVEFDLETLRPTYRLVTGLPGRSQALAIAERLGLPPALVAAARDRLGQREQAMEATLERIRAAEAELAERLAAARAAEERALAAARAAEEERRRAAREREELIAAARREADRLLEELRAELAEARRRLERGSLTPAVLAEMEGRLARRRAALPPIPASDAGRRIPRVGERVRSRSGGWEGEIVGLDRRARRATVQAGRLRVAVRLDDLEPSAGPAGGAREEGSGMGSTGAGGGGAGSLELERRLAVPASLDLRGARVEEALAALDRYLDDAALAGLESVTIVHGVGTGALRDAVRRHAAEHPLVRAVRPAPLEGGGEGATILEL